MSLTKEDDDKIETEQGKYEKRSCRYVLKSGKSESAFVPVNHRNINLGEELYKDRRDLLRDKNSRHEVPKHRLISSQDECNVHPSSSKQDDAATVNSKSSVNIKCRPITSNKDEYAKSSNKVQSGLNHERPHPQPHIFGNNVSQKIPEAENIQISKNKERQKRSPKGDNFLSDPSIYDNSSNTRIYPQYPEINSTNKEGHSHNNKDDDLINKRVRRRMGLQTVDNQIYNSSTFNNSEQIRADNYVTRDNPAVANKKHDRNNKTIVPTSRGDNMLRQRLRNDLDVLTRPSWCNAGFAYDQVCQGKATGSKYALCVRMHCHRFLFRLGCIIQRNPGTVLLIGLLLLGACSVGMKTASMETNVENLWVESGSQLKSELKYTKSFVPTESQGTFQVLIQTGHNVATRESLLLHLKAAMEAIKVTVTLYDQTWALEDICYKEVPDIGGEDNTILTLAEKMFPCSIIGPLDCFWDGSKLLGPDPPLDLFTKPPITWKNLDPVELLDSYNSFQHSIPELEQFADLFKQAGIDHGYLNRHCLNPSEPECPESSPNKNKEYPDVASILDGGCQGYATKLMQWPNDLIIGGIERSKDKIITRARGLQTTIQLWGAQSMYDMHKNNIKTASIRTGWDLSKAQNILTSWQRKFVETMYKINTTSTSDKLHAFAPSSTDDLILQFSNFSLVRVTAGYLLMIAYACITMMRCKASRSQGAVGIIGVLLVALSVAAGLGISSVMGIKFNAATTQVLPFLMLGLGVDDMFLIAHHFGQIAHLSYIPFEDRTGECLKRVGVSVLLTSIAILSGFLFCLLIPMPALQSFVSQAAVITVFNVFCILFVFPSVLSLDLIRRRNNQLDILCCFKSSSSSEVLTFSPDDVDVTQPKHHPCPSQSMNPSIHGDVSTSGEVELEEATVTVHHTIQAYSNQSYQTYLGPAAETTFISSPGFDDMTEPPVYTRHMPMTPPPQYTESGDHPPIVKEAFVQQRTKSFPETSQSISTVTRTVNRSSVSVGNPPPRTPRSTSRGPSNFVTPMESVMSSTHSLVAAKSNSGCCAWFCGIFYKCFGSRKNSSRVKYDHVMCFNLPTVSEFAERYYAPFIAKTPVRIVVLVLFVMVAALSVFGCLRVKDGLDLVDVLPRGSREHEAISAQMEYFSFYNMHIITKEFDYASNQQQLYGLHDKITNLKHVVRNTDGTKTKFWLHYFRDWLIGTESCQGHCEHDYSSVDICNDIGLQEALDEDWKKKVINSSTWTPQASDNGVLAFKLLLQTGRFDKPTDIGRIGCSLSTQCDKPDRVRLVSDDGYIREDAFYNYITAWVLHDPLSYAASQANIFPTPPKWMFARDNNNFIERASLFNYTQLPYYLNGLRTNEDFVSAIQSVRKICDYYGANSEVRAYPSGYPFLFWQQYITLRQWLFISLGAVIVAIFIVLSLALCNPWAAAIIALFLTIITTELLGFMGLAGVKLSAVPSVILIASIGLGVEFTVHVTLAFITSCGSRMDRVKLSLGHVSSPVLDGAVSTLLGVVMLSGSEFDFITKYFFQVLSVLVFIGFFNGIVLLPVVLSFIGPPAEVIPVGGANRLKTPTPPPTPPPKEYDASPCHCERCKAQYHYAASYSLHEHTRNPNSTSDLQYMQRRSRCDKCSVTHEHLHTPTRRTPKHFYACSTSGSNTPTGVFNSMPPPRDLQFRPPNAPNYYYSRNPSGMHTPVTCEDGRVVVYPAVDFVIYNAPNNDETSNAFSQNNTPHCDQNNDVPILPKQARPNDKTHSKETNGKQHVATMRSSVTVKVRPKRRQQQSQKITSPPLNYNQSGRSSWNDERWSHRIIEGMNPTMGHPVEYVPPYHPFSVPPQNTQPHIAHNSRENYIEHLHPPDHEMNPMTS